MFEQFIKERKLLSNVSPATVEWYKQSLAWLGTESPTDAQLKATVMRMREQGLKATGCNCRIRAINAYLKWAESPHHTPPMKEPQLVLPTFTAPQVKMLLGWKAKGFYQRRLHLLTLILLDTGCRISEATGIHVQDVDLDDLLLTVTGGQQATKSAVLFRATQGVVRPHAGVFVHSPSPTFAKEATEIDGFVGFSRVNSLGCHT
jgi:integrase/recombinase XerD